MTIKDMEKEVGITKANIRFYEKEGLISPARGSNNYREYTEEDKKTLEKIKYLRLLGISVSDIRLFIEGKRPLDKLMEEREEQIDQETRQLSRWKLLCGEMKKQNWDFEALDPTLLSMKINYDEKRRYEVMRRDHIQFLEKAEKWAFFFCMGCVLSMVFFPVNSILKVSVSDNVMEIWTAFALFSPFPYWILRVVNAGHDRGEMGRKQWGKREIKRAGNRKNHYEKQILDFNQICLASLFIIPLNRMFGIEWPLWLTIIWAVFVFGSTIAVAAVKNGR